MQISHHRLQTTHISKGMMANVRDFVQWKKKNHAWPERPCLSVAKKQ